MVYAAALPGKPSLQSSILLAHPVRLGRARAAPDLPVARRPPRITADHLPPRGPGAHPGRPFRPDRFLSGPRRFGMDRGGDQGPGGPRGSSPVRPRAGAALPRPGFSQGAREASPRDFVSPHYSRPLVDDAHLSGDAAALSRGARGRAAAAAARSALRRLRPLAEGDALRAARGGAAPILGGAVRGGYRGARPAARFSARSQPELLGGGVSLQARRGPDLAAPGAFGRLADDASRRPLGRVRNPASSLFGKRALPHPDADRRTQPCGLGAGHRLLRQPGRDEGGFPGRSELSRGPGANADEGQRGRGPPGVSL